MLTACDLLHAGSWAGRLGRSGCAPDCAVTFLCFAKEKSPTERRAGFVARRFAPVSCVARPGRGLAKLASLRQRQPLSDRACATRLLITALRPETEHTQYALLRVLGSSAVLPSPIEAGLSSAAARGSGRALFERSEFSPTPLDASSARHREAALTWARLSLLTFFGEAKKVSAQSGAHPDMPRLPGRLPPW